MIIAVKAINRSVQHSKGSSRNSFELNAKKSASISSMFKHSCDIKLRIALGRLGFVSIQYFCAVLPEVGRIWNEISFLFIDSF
jgi:hypothetical protein